MAFLNVMHLKTSATAEEEGWKGHLMGRDWDAFQKHDQNRVQKVINPRLYERHFQQKKAEPGKAN